MEKAKIYEDIAKRTSGDIYLGVVGPVRTGKSTFIKKFMESLVIPQIEDEFVRERAKDELPQSGSGKTIMTAEPKFVPEEAVSIEMSSSTRLSFRLVDCVGYMVDGALGDSENGSERMVTTPWFDTEVPLRTAAETGTKKVITEHSTVGIVVTTDGSFGDIPRDAYIPAESRVISELKAIGKPFVVLVNSSDPDSDIAADVCESISEKYSISCLPVNCMTLKEGDILDILRSVLDEFPVIEYSIFMPRWIDTLPDDNTLRSELTENVISAIRGARVFRDTEVVTAKLSQSEAADHVSVTKSDPGTGTVSICIAVKDDLFYDTVSQLSGFDIKNDGDLIGLLSEISGLKCQYEKVSAALEDVNRTGYGVVMPGREDLKLQEPEIIRKGGKYSVLLKATAPSIHMIRTDIETEVAPAVGGERSSSDIISFLLQEFEGDTSKIWESNIFGKSLYDIANDSLQSKIRKMPVETQRKLRDALSRIVNDGAGGLICIII